ncbi:MAG TPA: FIST N-terminal domain-containing protein [Pirellulales bacterium]|nr:FIST N-terminal domain-containing protein [Pirellulales bacterium]
MTVATGVGLRFAAALSTLENTDDAVARACDEAGEQLGARPDLAMVFFSPHHAAKAKTASEEIRRRLSPGCLLGCTAEAIVGGSREVEGDAAVSLWLAAMPGVTLHSLSLEFQRSPEGGAVSGWPDDLPASSPPGSALLLLADPFSFPADWLLERLSEDRPGVPVLGGMASGAASPGGNRLLLNDRVLDSGAVGALLYGAVEVQPVVSQGCRPIGRHYVITKAEQNVILELSGKPPLAQLQELFDTLSARDQQLVQGGLHVGRVINEYQDRFQRGDFLVRNCIGADRDTGALAIGDFVRAGQTVQFHLRDAQTADEDLREMVAGATGATGALLFTCNGRGTRLFDQPDHDVSVLRELLGPIPVAGFFAQGEMGPIGGKNFLHGFTASCALFRPRSSSKP